MTNLFRLCVLAIGIASLAVTVSCGGGGDDSTKTRLVIVNNNILHGIMDEDPTAENFERIAERIPLIAGALQGEDPDLVTLQEVLDKPGPDYPNIRETVLGALGTGYSAVAGNFLADAIDNGGLGQMTVTRLEILSSENKAVSAIRSVVRVTVQTESGPISLYNVHLEGTGAVLETGAPAELEEIENVIEFVEATRAGGPAIVAGDFNATPDDPSIQRFIEAGFIDALAEAGDATCEEVGDPGCTSGTIPLGDNPDNLTDHRIDYIFVLPGDTVDIDVTDASLFDNEPFDIGDGHTLWGSDHIGVRAVVELSQRD